MSTVPRTPRTPDELHAFVARKFNIHLPRTPLEPTHHAPFDYLCWAFFEGAIPSQSRSHGVTQSRSGPARTPAHDELAPTHPAARATVDPRATSAPTADWLLPTGSSASDSILWASRGSGKTFLGALATALDLYFKPGIEIRILGGSMEQSKRMHAHLRRLAQTPILAELIDGRVTESRLALITGSRVELLAQSQTSVRGTRVHKLRCDEVELFNDDVWEAAQLVTRSQRLGDFDVRGSVECFSTMHKPHGLMSRLVDECRRGLRRLFRWGVLDVLEHCPDARRCETCGLHDDCAGRAKERPAPVYGHVRIDDALRMKQRASKAAWRAEMLCLRPSRSHTVYPEFDPALHVVAHCPFEHLLRRGSADTAPAEALHAAGATGTPPLLIAGIDFGFRAPTAVLLAALDHDGTLWILDERVEPEVVLSRHAADLRDGTLGHAPREREGAGASALGLAHEVAPTHDRAPALASGGAGLPWRTPAWVGVDPAGRNTSDQTGRSSIDVLKDAGLAVRARRLPVAVGLGLVRARMDPAMQGPVFGNRQPASGAPDLGPPRGDRFDASASSPNAECRTPDAVCPPGDWHLPTGSASSSSSAQCLVPGASALLIHSRCTALIRALEQYHYPDDDPETTQPEKDGPDHACDALRYLVQNLDRHARVESRRYA